MEGFFVSGGNPRFQEAMPNGGLTIELVPQLSIYGSYAEGFTMPDVGRILRAVNTPGQDVDSLLNLEPVVTRNLEFGFDFESSRARLHVAWYRSDAKLGSRLELVNEIYNVRREKTQIHGASDADVRAPRSSSLPILPFTTRRAFGDVTTFA